MFVKEIIDSSKSPKDKENVAQVLNEDIKPKKKAKKQSKMSSFFGNDNEIIIEAGNKISAEININNNILEPYLHG